MRFTITRQDRSNWVALGDIEVFAEGFEHEGSAILKWSFEEPINVGRIRWQTRVFDQTVFRLLQKIEMTRATGTLFIRWIKTVSLLGLNQL